MIFSPRISLANIAGLCRRLSLSLHSGIEMRTVWAREAHRAHGAARRRMAIVNQAIQHGESLTTAFAAAGDYFPLLFRELVEVGEMTGHQAEIFGQLADHYDLRRNLRRTFLASISWPMVQLGMAIGVIGFLIWIMGAINQSRDAQFDPLGWGLIGNRGLAIYLTCVFSVAAVVGVLIFAFQRGWFWTKPIQRVVFAIPMLGPSLQALSLARLAWSMHLTMNTGMDVRRALAVSLRSTQNARLIDQIPVIDAQIMAGNSIYEAFCSAGEYPAEFLDSLAVSEESGRLVESLGMLSRQYQERARLALAALTSVTSFLVWAVVAAFIIVMIFRLYSSYIGGIRSLTNMR